MGGESRPTVPLADSTTARLFYSGLTIGLVVLLLLVINRLQTAPLSQVSFGDTIPVGYKVVSDEARQLSFDLPRGWQTLDPLNAEDRAELERFLADFDLVLQEAVQPWGETAGDLELSYLALPTSAWRPGLDPFVVVVRSERLANLPPERLILMAEQFPWLPVRQVSYVEDNDKSHVSVDLVTFPLDESRQAEFSGYIYLCSQQLVSRPQTALLLAVCLPQNGNQTALQSRNDQTLRENVRESFQFLE